MYTTRVFEKVHDTHPKEKLIWDSAKVDDKKEYWQKIPNIRQLKSTQWE